jgi:hypothetical protein
VTALEHHCEWAGAVDRLDLMHVMLGHPDLPLRVDVGGELLDVEDFRFAPERGAVVLLLHQGAVHGVPAGQPLCPG